MKQMIKIVRRIDLEKQYEHLLKLELDYELASLYAALQSKDNKEIVRSKSRLKEISEELEGLNAYA